MKIYSEGVPIEITGRRGLPGPAGPDGNPIGTILSFMGKVAPAGYLICDGAEYNIAEYSQLAEFFQAQFGTINYFGGDGEITFAVPNLCNLFLRGYHNGADEQLSGEIGERQAATEHPSISGGSNIAFHSGGVGILPTNIDTGIGGPHGNRYARMDGIGDTEFYAYYSARPVNMAVLYCIKAVPSGSCEEAYSMEETRIGTWMDGKPIYRQIYQTKTTQIGDGMDLFDVRALNIDSLIECRGFVDSHPGSSYHQKLVVLNYLGSDSSISLYYENGFLKMNLRGSYSVNQDCVIILEYTKTTD